MHRLLAVLISSVALSAERPRSYTISTVAGGGLPLDIPGTEAAFRDPQGIAVDAAGNVFFSSGHSVFRLDGETGMLSLAAGRGTAGFSGDGGSATEAELCSPQGIALDSGGTLYIADLCNVRVRKVTNGVITTVAGYGALGSSGDNGPALRATFGYPSSIAVDAEGSALYIGDSIGFRVRKVADGVITTVAGTGIQGFSGDGGPATSARLNYVRGLAVDQAGGLHFSEQSNEGDARVRKVSAGIITTVAGAGPSGFRGDGGPATSALLRGPSGLAVSSNGEIYIADNSRVRRVARGVITTIAGNGGLRNLAEGQIATRALMFPQGVAVDASGDVYVTDGAFHRIRKVTRGIISTVAGGGPASGSQLLQPLHIAVNSAGDVYISDRVDMRLRQVSGGVMSTAAGIGLETEPFVLPNGDGGLAIHARLEAPKQVTTDSCGNIYLADGSGIRKISNGVITTVAGNQRQSGTTEDNAPATDTKMSPAAIVGDGAGDLYFVDQLSQAVRKVSGGEVTTVAGGGSGFAEGVAATTVQLSVPQALALDGEGNLFIADSGTRRVHKVSRGVITTVAGGGNLQGDNVEAKRASLFPIGLALDSASNLFILEPERIRRVADGVVTTVAGGGNDFGDGGPATKARLVALTSIAAGPEGSVYLADQMNGRVRVLTPLVD